MADPGNIWPSESGPVLELWHTVVQVVSAKLLPAE